MATTTLTVGGMTCNGCVGSVSEVLGRLDGVDDVQVTLESGRAVVQHQQLDEQLLVQTVEAAGFDAKVSPA